MPRRMAREPKAAVTAAEATAPTNTPAPPAAAPARERKIDKVLGLLQRPEGATLAELIEATGWLPHTTRAALTGLGHATGPRWGAFAPCRSAASSQVTTQCAAGGLVARPRALPIHVPSFPVAQGARLIAFRRPPR